jgi:outer membrane protein OmpA-like peptidoglycan-associated protein
MRSWWRLVALLFPVVMSCGGGQLDAKNGAAGTPSSVASTSPPSAPKACTPEALAWKPDASATPDPTLLSWRGGTIVRSYPVEKLDKDQNVGSLPESGPSYAKGAKGPFVFVFELAGEGAIQSFSATLPTKGADDAASVDFAVALCDPNVFTDVGTLTANDDAGTKTLAANINAHWIRVTTNGPPFRAIGATGVLAPLPSGVSPAGIYVEAREGERYGNGAFTTPPDESKSPWYVTLTSFGGGGLSATECRPGRFSDVYPGTIKDRIWAFRQKDTSSKMFVSDDGTRIVGSNDGGGSMVLERTTTVPDFCTHRKSGKGPRQVLVLDNENAPAIWPVADDDVPGYAWDRIAATMLDDTSLVGKDIVIMNMLCDPKRFLGKAQTDALLAWTAAGHELLISDADQCPKGTRYDFLPYPFVSSNPGAKGAAGDALIVVESDVLGSTDDQDTTHYFDPKTYLNNGNNQLGDANTVSSSDPHWCGHLFGTNVLKVNGFMQMYAPYETGIIVYDAFDVDDAGNPGYRRTRLLELALPIPNALPCTQKVSDGFVIEPDQDTTFVPGTTQTLPFTMQLLANQGWKGHVDVTATAASGLSATVTPASFDIAGGTKALAISVTIPASAKGSTYTVSVAGTGKDGSKAEAVISLTATAANQQLKAQLSQERVVLYGIHFDVNSAHIQPRSEAIIDAIAQVMKDNPSWRFQVEGHTDTDGGGPYNLGLSQRRAESVVDDLVNRKKIARTRLVPLGFGLTRPVAPNTTQAGKALNRRVELSRLH